MTDELTADLQTLERLELTTRTHPARDIFGPLLLAQIARTRQLGQQKLDEPLNIEPGEEWRLPAHNPEPLAELIPARTIPEDAGPPHWEGEDE